VTGEMADDGAPVAEKKEGGMRQFLSEGNARWTALAGLLLIVGVTAVVIKNPKGASQLRQQVPPDRCASRDVR